jgi:DNA-directed RNA polymerase beta subunit
VSYQLGAEPFDVKNVNNVSNLHRSHCVKVRLTIMDKERLQNQPLKGKQEVCMGVVMTENGSFVLMGTEH